MLHIWLLSPKTRQTTDRNPISHVSEYHIKWSEQLSWGQKSLTEVCSTVKFCRHGILAICYLHNFNHPCLTWSKRQAGFFLQKSTFQGNLTNSWNLNISVLYYLWSHVWYSTLKVYKCAHVKKANIFSDISPTNERNIIWPCDLSYSNDEVTSMSTQSYPKTYQVWIFEKWQAYLPIVANR